MIINHIHYDDDLVNHKLKVLANIEACECETELLEQMDPNDKVCPAICMNDECEYATYFEPDCEAGWCDECGTPTVVSALILMRII